MMPRSAPGETWQRAILGKLYYYAYPFARLWWRIAAPVKIGVRAVVFDAQGRVLLVRHAYGSEGWGFPGGAPGRLETLEATAQREVWEETGVRCRVERLLGIYDSFAEGRSDHVALFVCTALDAEHAKAVCAEIVEAAFFTLDTMPGSASAGTRRRLAELQSSHLNYWGDW
jgi:ADP-ribose pyrophosphatase YjhB (NUDIX family)